jgi:hypothetical protein
MIKVGKIKKQIFYCSDVPCRENIAVKDTDVTYIQDVEWN